MTRDLTEKNLVEEAEVFADISNVNLYDGRNVIQPEDLELLPQEMHYKDSEGKPAKVMADVRMRWRKNGSVIAMIQIENQSEINNIMPIRDLGYIFNNYNEQIKEHQRENERNGRHFYARELEADECLQPVITFILYYGKEEWVGQQRPLMSPPALVQALAEADRGGQPHRTGHIGRARLAGQGRRGKGGTRHAHPVHHPAAKPRRLHGLFGVEQPHSEGPAQLVPGADEPVTVQYRYVDGTMTDRLGPVHQHLDAPAAAEGY